ncbi:MAG: DUF6783 domain-containing protein [Fusicatenibacter saccharivorans]
MRLSSSACLKNHFRKLQAPLCGRFCPHSVAVAGLSRPHSDKISHHLELAACEKPFSDTLCTAASPFLF